MRQFMKISNQPGGIEAAAKKVSGSSILLPLFLNCYDHIKMMRSSLIFAEIHYK